MHRLRCQAAGPSQKFPLMHREVQYTERISVACPKAHKLGAWKEGAYSIGSEGLSKNSDGLLVTKHILRNGKTHLAWKIAQDKNIAAQEKEKEEHRLREWISLKDRASFATYSPYSLAGLKPANSLTSMFRTRNQPSTKATEHTKHPLFDQPFENPPNFSDFTARTLGIPEFRFRNNLGDFFLDTPPRTGASGHGAFFSLVNRSQREATIHALHLAASAGAAGMPQNIRIYARAGSADGVESDGGAWTCCLDAHDAVLPVAPYPSPLTDAADSADARPQVPLPQSCARTVAQTAMAKRRDGGGRACGMDWGMGGQFGRLELERAMRIGGRGRAAVLVHSSRPHGIALCCAGCGPARSDIRLRGPAGGLASFRWRAGACPALCRRRRCGSHAGGCMCRCLCAHALTAVARA